MSKFVVIFFMQREFLKGIFMRLKLKLYIIVANISQVELTAILDVSKTYVSNIETGKCMPSPNLFDKMSTSLNVCPYNLVDFCVDCKTKNKCIFNCEEFYDVMPP